jgi:hypothetical protein
VKCSFSISCALHRCTFYTHPRCNLCRLLQIVALAVACLQTAAPLQIPCRQRAIRTLTPLGQGGEMARSQKSEDVKHFSHEDPHRAKIDRWPTVAKLSRKTSCFWVLAHFVARWVCVRSKSPYPASALGAGLPTPPFDWTGGLPVRWRPAVLAGAGSGDPRTAVGGVPKGSGPEAFSHHATPPPPAN